MSPQLPSGVLAAGLTPFQSDLSVDPDTLVQHTQRLLREGCDGVLLFGTTGEGLSLSVDEREAGLDAVLSAGISAKRLLVGTGALALPDALNLTRTATERGVGGVLVLPPFHFRQISPEGLFRFYDRLIQGVGDSSLRLYFYHFPELSGVPIPFDLIERLRGTYPGQIAGIKDSSGEWDHTEALCQQFPDLQVFSGTERLLLRVLEAGGDGCISATANVTAPVAAAVRTRWRAGDDASDIQETLTNLRTAFAPLPTIPALKMLLSRRLDASHWTPVRPPLARLTDEDEDAVMDILTQMRTEALLENWSE
jgi:4-hydroxy-tetrahydrodipicolinate synthase